MNKVDAGWNPPVVSSISSKYDVYPLVICYIAIENTTFIVDLPIQNGDVL